MEYSKDMFESSQCQLMHIDLELRGLPGRLSDMRTTVENGNSQKIFTEVDDLAVASIQDPWIENGTFSPCFRAFLNLKKRVSFNVLGYGLFTPLQIGFLTLQEVEVFNQRLLNLRDMVSRILLARYATELKRQYISRFNPRVKCALHLIPRYLIVNEDFLRQLHRTFKDELREKEMSIEWLLQPPKTSPLLKKSIAMKDAKSELCTSYLESEFGKLF